MNIFEKYKQAYKTIVASLASIITTFLLDVTDGFFKDERFAKTAIIIFVILIIYIGNLLIDRIIDKSMFVRRILMGKGFLEGYYYDISIDKENNSIKHGVIFHLEYEQGEYTASGVTYNIEGDKIATWKSNGSCYSHNTLFIRYESYTDYSKNFIENGLLQIQFDKPPTSYTGFYIDYTNSLRFLIRGTKVSKEQLKEYKNFVNEISKKDFVKNILLAKYNELIAKNK